MRHGAASGIPFFAMRPEARMRALLTLCYEHLVYYGLLAIFALSSLAWSSVAALLRPVLPARMREPLGQFMIMAGFRYFVGLMQLTGIIKCDLTALDTLRDTPSLVIAPNHPSLLDAVLVISRLPHVACTAKARLFGNPLLGGSARLAGFIANDVPTRLVKEGIRQLQAGRQLLIFPEGTRTSGQAVDRFKGGFALIAQRAGVPVQTVFIDSNSPFLGKGWSLLRKPDFPLTYRVRLGPALTVDGDVRHFIAELRERYRHALTKDAA